MVHEIFGSLDPDDPISPHFKKVMNKTPEEIHQGQGLYLIDGISDPELYECLHRICIRMKMRHWPPTFHILENEKESAMSYFETGHGAMIFATGKVMDCSIGEFLAIAVHELQEFQNHKPARRKSLYADPYNPTQQEEHAREYDADQKAAELVGKEYVISALEKTVAGNEATPKHPSTADRIARLRQLQPPGPAR